MSRQPSSEPTRAEEVRHLGGLTMRSTREDTTHVIALEGELDLASAGLVEGELQRVETTDAQEIVIDLRELQFIDSTGVRLVYLADARAHQNGGRLTIRRGPERVQRIFVLTDLADRLPFVD